jgi:glycosyltransferase involved in cell wall biosynthesis
MKNTTKKPIVLFLTSYPPRPCGIATFSQDLINALRSKFGEIYDLKICALENSLGTQYDYPDEVLYQLNTHSLTSIMDVGARINNHSNIELVCIQHEFGLWGGNQGELILDLLNLLKKPVITVFHTVLPQPDRKKLLIIQTIDKNSQQLVVMTKNSSDILRKDYNILANKISVITHGTHPVSWSGQNRLKEKYGLTDNLVLSTFGLLGPNKGIETSLRALPELISSFPKIKFFILGRTHPELVKQEGEKYRKMLEDIVAELGLENHVSFINKYLSLTELLEYLKLTDIYLFSSIDPNQAVSGTFAYAMSCGCPIVSTPIPHALEALDKKSGVLFDFENHQSLTRVIKPLLANEKLRKDMALHAFQKTRASIWDNIAVAYHDRFQKITPTEIVSYKKPTVNLKHIKKLTDSFGIIQFSKIGKPDKSSGYTIDDNARALIAMIMHYEATRDQADLMYITTYLNFIEYCQQDDGKFQNYVDEERTFHKLNDYVNLEDSNSRAIWALGFVIHNEDVLPEAIVQKADNCLEKSSRWLAHVQSPRAIALVIKGLYYYYQTRNSVEVKDLIKLLADKLISRFLATSDEKWVWFENYLTYANSILPEALIYAYDVTKRPLYMKIGMNTFNFLIMHTFKNNYLQVISNRGWFHKGTKPEQHGEQPIDVAYTIQTLDAFYRIIGIERYHYLMEKAFTWFLGNNQLRQMVYDHQTGGCSDGLEKESVNLNQGAESTVCYLMARLTVEKYNMEMSTLALKEVDAVAGKK